MSSVSVVDVWELDASDRELSEGVSWCGRWGMTAGDSERPLPKTRPPPRDLRDAMVYERHAADSCRLAIPLFGS